MVLPAQLNMANIESLIFCWESFAFIPESCVPSMRVVGSYESHYLLPPNTEIAADDVTSDPPSVLMTLALIQ